MEIELEPRVKPLSYKVKGMSREALPQKASHVLDTDLRSHWSTGTNTKEWILLELDEPCLLSHIRIYNKSVLEWEIAAGLRYKPETFVKVRSRCEAPRRDMVYPMNYTPCRYVRISCLRGNPIAIFFIQLIGVPVAGLEPEFQPVVHHLLPHIVSQKQDDHDMHLQLLQDLTYRLLPFLPQLEADLSGFSDAADADLNLRFLAMLAGPFYPILHLVNERAASKSSGNVMEPDISKNSQLSSALTVSSNFEPRRSRSTSPFLSMTSSCIVFRPDAIFILLRKAYGDSDLGTVCRMASRILNRLIDPVIEREHSTSAGEGTSASDEKSKSDLFNPGPMIDYSNLFGEDFKMLDDHLDSSYLNVLDIAAVEEGVLHVLYACASQPILCRKLAERISDFHMALPLIQALLPALRPSPSSSLDIVNENFSQWKQPVVQQALSQIVATTSSSLFHPLLHACAGFLSSFSQSHAKAACILIDLCSSVLAPWMAQVTAKVDLALELLEDLLGAIQGARHCTAQACAALKYILLALSGQMDDILGKYKEVKHRILFLFEMLEPFLDPVIGVLKNTIAFGNLFSVLPEKQEHDCLIALNVIRKAVQKPAVLPSLEAEWRRGSVAASVLLAILEPHLQLPPEIDLCKTSTPKQLELQSSVLRQEGASSKPNNLDDCEMRIDDHDMDAKMDVCEDAILYFAPQELRGTVLTEDGSMIPSHRDINCAIKDMVQKNIANNVYTDVVIDAGIDTDSFNLQADYLQLVNYRDNDQRASEFQRLALDLHSSNEITTESHDVAIDALLLAAECYVNPYFMLSCRASPDLTNPITSRGTKDMAIQFQSTPEIRRLSDKNKSGLETIAHLEKKRDKIVLQILLEAAELDMKYHMKITSGEHSPYNCVVFDEQVIRLSSHDIQSADAVTLVRRNQALLFSFVIQRLQREQNSVHEILLQTLVFLLHSATKLYCAPELVVDIILGSAESLYGTLTSLSAQLKEASFELEPEKIHGIKRRWLLLKKLVCASSGGNEVLDFASTRNGFRYWNLIPASAWMDRIANFSACQCPLVRFLGWMAVSRNAKQYLKDHLFLASNLSQITCLLHIFADELSVVDIVVNEEHELIFEGMEVKDAPSVNREFEVAKYRADQSFRVIFPDLSKFFPNMKKQFESFGEIILEAVGLHIKSLSSTVLPDILCWFSDLCLWPFCDKDQTSQCNSDYLKGYISRNAKAIILYILEAIVSEHMEAMVPEIPRLVQVLVSLCRATYCDVSFLDAVLLFLKPIISYSLRKVSAEESLLVEDSCLNFESICFDELFNNIKQKNENQDILGDKVYNRALTIFILASLYPDLSFQRKKEMLQSLTIWTAFASSEPTSAFHDYLSSFKRVMESCRDLLLQTLRRYGVVPLRVPQFSDLSTGAIREKTSKSHPWFLSDVCESSRPNSNLEKVGGTNSDIVLENQRSSDLSLEEIEQLCQDIENLIAKLNPTIELCWNLHQQLARKLTVIVAECLVYSRLLSSTAKKAYDAEDCEGGNPLPFERVKRFSVHWQIGLEGFVETILKLEEDNCWEVASMMLNCILELPRCFTLNKVVGTLCSAIKNASCNAPKVSWRLQTHKWLSVLLGRGISSFHESEVPLIDLFCTLLGHPEPEQRYIALQHLGKLVGQDFHDGAIQYSRFLDDYKTAGLDESIEPILSHLASHTWDLVAALAASDTSLFLRTCAMRLLLDYVPFAGRQQLRSLLTAADSIYGMGSIVHPECEGPILQLSLALIASASLYSPSEDISLIPENAWRKIENLGLSRTDGRPMNLERKTCQALCRLRDQGGEAEEVLRELLSSNSSKEVEPDFENTRETIIQVLANITSVQSYFDILSEKREQEVMELEEAEIELDIAQMEHALLESSKDSKVGCQGACVASSTKDDSRLQQIKDNILSLDKGKLREDIVTRRQKKLLMRHARQKYLEDAALREAELLQELDRERIAEVEKEIERQRLLEFERAKTRELRHNLDMEKEKQTQRELQRDLEQAESGLQLSRRDFASSAHSSRPRERYRERENGRSSNERSSRVSRDNSLQPETSTTSSMIGVPMVLSASRQFSGQPPTILQSRDRSDECGSSIEENVDGSKDSGDTGSVGDPDLVSLFDGQSGGFGSGQRQGSRGSKSRQVTERRERDGRRESKWERKHS